MSASFSPPINQQFPRSVLTVSRQEFGDPQDNPQASAPPLHFHFKPESKLQQLPADMQGYVYMVGPVGSVDSVKPDPTTDPYVVQPTEDGTTMLYNGDGMVYRFDFAHPEAGLALTTRIAQTPDYIADAVTRTCPQFQSLKFNSIGITRVGSLGLRNQLNTAFLPMKFRGDDRVRLMLTWDMGRPYEIDPQTLEAVTPIGWDHEWKPVTELTNLPFEPPQPFKSIQTAAHPYFDARQYGGQVYTTNVGRSLYNLFSQIIPLGYAIKEWLFPTPPDPKERVPDPRVPAPPPESEDKLKNILGLVIQIIRSILEFFSGSFVDLIMWDGVSPFQRWRILCNGRPISIKQTTHQMMATEDYILVADTAFKISIEELLPSLNSIKYQAIEKAIRDFLDHPQLSYIPIHIISRKDLKLGSSTVNARKALVPWESAHFLTNYQNPEGKITIHFSHVCAWDAGEVVTEFDYLGSDAPKPTPGLSPLYGILYGPTDISRLGYHLIDGETGKILNSEFVADPALTWGPAIYAYRPESDYTFTPNQIQDLYWICLGCWSELLLPHILKLYDDYKYRMIALSLIKQITQQGRPSTLLRVHVEPAENPDPEQETIYIADAYGFPDGYYVMTPQFVPSSNRTGSQDGYIVCLVHYDPNPAGTEAETRGNEVWIFDATDLAQGPICKLWHPQFKVGFTVHSSWIQTAERRTSDYFIPVREDYEKVVSQQSELVQTLFEDWIYPQRIPTDPADCATSPASIS